MSNEKLESSDLQSNLQNETGTTERGEGEILESEILDNSSENLERSASNSLNVEAALNKLLQRQEGLENLLSSFTQRQQCVEGTLNRFLEQQTVSNDQFRKQFERIQNSMVSQQTVEGNKNPAGRPNALASDRVATDTTLGNPWLITKNPGITHSELENRLFMSAPHKTIDNLASVAPSMESRANPALYSLSSDLNSRTIGRSFVSTFPQQYVQSLEGATHASIEAS